MSRELPLAACPPAERVAVVPSRGLVRTGTSGGAVGAATSAVPSAGGAPMGAAGGATCARTGMLHPHTAVTAKQQTERRKKSLLVKKALPYRSAPPGGNDNYLLVRRRGRSRGRRCGRVGRRSAVLDVELDATVVGAPLVGGVVVNGLVLTESDGGQTSLVDPVLGQPRLDRLGASL